MARSTRGVAVKSSPGRAAFAVVVLGGSLVGLGALAGCELLVQFDRDKVGATGGGGGAGGGDGGGGAGGCVVEANCADVAKPCAPAKCMQGSCVAVPAGMGSEEGIGDGDCVKLLCDGSGEGESLADDSDVPDDANDCTEDTCSGGAEVHTPRPAGSSCGLALICDDEGTCGECNVAADCSAGQVAPPCSTVACVAHACALVPVADGTELPAAQQTAGDCVEKVCEGGQIAEVPSDQDQPDDLDDCTADSCQDGAPVFVNKPVDTPCGANGSLFCDGGGACVGCMAADDCAVNVACAHPTCVAAACGIKLEAAGVEVPPGDQIPGDCARLFCDGAGHAAPQPDDLDAPGAQACATGACVNGSVSSMPFPAGTVCNGDRACDGAGVCLGAPCLVPSDCAGGGTCVDGVCCESGCPGVCSACSFAKKGAGLNGICGLVSAGQDPDAECPGAEVCSGDANDLCKSPAGEVCLGSGDCLSGFCVDGVCCEAACNSLCRSCALAGSQGQCTPYPAGTDPEDECNGMKKCNGAGACQ